MGNHVFVGERAVVNAALVGCYVYIGKDAIIVRINDSYLQVVQAFNQSYLFRCRADGPF